MSEQSKNKPSLLARVNYPLYCVQTLSERHILVAGGGGSARTGIANSCDIYELIYDPGTNSCRANLVTHFNPGACAIMNLCLINKPDSKFEYELLTNGENGVCNVYSISLFNINNGQNHHSTHDPSSAHESNLRRRHFSISSQNSFDEDLEGDRSTVNGGFRQDVGGDHNPNRFKSSTAIPKVAEDSNTVNGNIPEYGFKFRPKCWFQTDFHPVEPYQKKIKYSPSAELAFSTGADFKIRMWRREVQMNDVTYHKEREIDAHHDEIDDIDVHPSGIHLVSVSRDERNNVWDVRTGQLITSLDHYPVIYGYLGIPLPGNEPPGTGRTRQSNNEGLKQQQQPPKPPKFIARACRYGTVEGDVTNIRLFTMLNPLVKTKPSPGSCLAKWHVKQNQYRLEKLVPAGAEHLSALAISDNGQFLGVATLEGSVDVYISFSLQRCYHVTRAHNIFVTGLEFLPINRTSLELVGDETDAALISISVDNHIVMHKIPRRATLGFVGSFISFFIFMLCVYLLMNYFNV